MQAHTVGARATLECTAVCAGTLRRDIGLPHSPSELCRQHSRDRTHVHEEEALPVGGAVLLHAPGRLLALHRSLLPLLLLRKRCPCHRVLQRHLPPHSAAAPPRQPAWLLPVCVACPRGRGRLVQLRRSLRRQRWAHCARYCSHRRPSPPSPASLLAALMHTMPSSRPIRTSRGLRYLSLRRVAARSARRGLACVDMPPQSVLLREPRGPGPSPCPLGLLGPGLVADAGHVYACPELPQRVGQE